MNPSTSLGTRSNVGMAKPSPPVRQAGNIRRLLVIHGVCRRSLPSACAHVKSRCRCRDTVISRASDEYPVVARPWPGGEKRRGRRASHHEECEALGSFLLPCAATGVSLLAVQCLIGGTPRGQPWTPAVTLPQGCDGLRARRMAVLWTFREPSL